jgi:hypothetical protein
MEIRAVRAIRTPWREFGNCSSVRQPVRAFHWTRVSTIQEDRAPDFRTTVTHGASERLAPILMTAMAAGLALVPIALGMGNPEVNFRRPWR